MKISTKAAIARAGGTQQALADLLGIKRQAVQAMGQHLPELRAYKLKDLKPYWIKPLLDATRAEEAQMARDRAQETADSAQQ